MIFSGLKTAFDDVAPDPYGAFQASAEQVSAQTGFGYESSFPPSTVEAFSHGVTPSPVSTLASRIEPSEPAKTTASPGSNNGAVQKNDKVDAVLGMQVQKANKPGGDMGTSVRTTQKLVEQGNMFQAAKASLNGQGPESKGPQKDILGNNVESSLAGRAINFAAGTIGGGVAVAAAAAFAGPKVAAAVGASLAAKDIGGFVSAVNGPRTAEETIAMDSQYKAQNNAKGFGEGKRGMRGGYDYVSRGPSPEQQARMASAGGGSIRVDPTFRVQYASDSLAGVNGVNLDKGDPTIRALNERGKELSVQMDAQRTALATPVTRQGWDGVTKAEAAGLNVRPGNTTMESLVPKDQLAQLRKFDAPSLTV